MRASGCLRGWPQLLISAATMLLSMSVLAPAAGANDRNKTEIVPQLGHSNTVTSVAFSPDGRHVLSGAGDSSIKLWDAATGTLVRTFDGHSDRVISVAISPDGRQLASGAGDNTVKLWDAATGVLVRTFTGHSGWVISVKFSPDGRQLLSGSHDKTVKLARSWPYERPPHCASRL